MVALRLKMSCLAGLLAGGDLCGGCVLTVEMITMGLVLPRFLLYCLGELMKPNPAGCFHR